MANYDVEILQEYVPGFDVLVRLINGEKTESENNCC